MLGKKCCFKSGTSLSCMNVLSLRQTIIGFDVFMMSFYFSVAHCIALFFSALHKASVENNERIFLSARDEK